MFNNCELRFFKPNKCIQLICACALHWYIEWHSFRKHNRDWREKEPLPTVMWDLDISWANFRWFECLEPIQNEFKCKTKRGREQYKLQSIFAIQHSTQWWNFMSCGLFKNLCMALYNIFFISLTTAPIDSSVWCFYYYNSNK